MTEKYEYYLRHYNANTINVGGVSVPFNTAVPAFLTTDEASTLKDQGWVVRLRDRNGENDIAESFNLKIISQSTYTLNTDDNKATLIFTQNEPDRMIRVTLPDFIKSGFSVDIIRYGLSDVVLDGDVIGRADQQSSYIYQKIAQFEKMTLMVVTDSPTLYLVVGASVLGTQLDIDDLSAVNITSEGFTLTWTVPPKAVLYELFIDDEYVTEFSSNVANGSYEVTGLTSATDYTSIYLVAYSDLEYAISTTSNTIEIVTTLA